MKLWLKSTERSEKGEDSDGEVVYSEKCPKCHGTGWELYLKMVPWGQEYEYARKCDCGAYAKSIIKNRLEFANIPEKYKHSTFANFDRDIYKNPQNVKDIKGIYNIILKWLGSVDGNKGKGLYLYSRTKGSGKTRMAAAISNEFINSKNKSVRFATSQRILDEIKSTWDRDSAISENELIKGLTKADVLVIDDFGTGFGTDKQKDWINNKFFAIVNDRYFNEQITIFTSNEDINHLNCDERIKSRIKEMAFEIPFPEEDVREHIAKSDLLNMMGGRDEH